MHRILNKHFPRQTDIFLSPIECYEGKFCLVRFLSHLKGPTMESTSVRIVIENTSVRLLKEIVMKFCSRFVSLDNNCVCKLDCSCVVDSLSYSFEAQVLRSWSSLVLLPFTLKWIYLFTSETETESVHKRNMNFNTKKGISISFVRLKISFVFSR